MTITGPIDPRIRRQHEDQFTFPLRRDPKTGKVELVLSGDSALATDPQKGLDLLVGEGIEITSGSPFKLRLVESQVRAIVGRMTSATVQIERGKLVTVLTIDDIGGELAGDVSGPLGANTIADVTGTGSFVRTEESTLDKPFIATFVNANHNHTNAAGGGTLSQASLVDASATPTGSFIPVADGDGFLDAWLSSAIVRQGGTGSFSAHAGAGTSPWEHWMALNINGSSAMTTGALSIDTIYAVPFVAPADRSAPALDRLAIEVTTPSATGSARLAIYTPTSATNLYPSARVIDAGTVSTAGAAMQAATIAQALTPGSLYWAAMVLNEAATIRAGNNQYSSVLGYPSTGGTIPYWGCTVAMAYGTFPDPFPGSAALVSATPRPVVFGRYSA